MLKKPLSPAEMTQTMEAIISGKVSDAEIEVFLLALRERGESVEEITAAAKVMRRHAAKLSKHIDGLLDTCGTGGDAQQTLNVSTLAALIVASLGVPVAKHGNRSVSSLCGSADLLEMLDVRIDLSAEEIERSIEKMHFGFFFAPQFHPATRFAMPARKRIQGKTLFNLLGPLCNPAEAEFQLIGVYDESLVEKIAQVLSRLGVKRALVVYGSDGLDEITICGKTKIAELTHGRIKVYTISPEEFGIKKAKRESLKCGSKNENKTKALAILKGEAGPASDIVCLNAGAALYIAGKCPSIKEGLRLAREAVVSGAAMKKLEELRTL